MEIQTATPEADVLEEKTPEYLDVDTKPYTMPNDFFEEDHIKRYAKHNWEF
jgi:hypothetical protein